MIGKKIRNICLQENADKQIIWKGKISIVGEDGDRGQNIVDSATKTLLIL